MMTLKVMISQYSLSGYMHWRTTHFCSSLSSDMPAVERLALSEILQSSLDLSEVDDNEIERFKELRQRMIQLDRADLGPTKPVISPQHYLRAAEGDRFHTTQPPSMKRYVNVY